MNITITYNDTETMTMNVHSEDEIYKAVGKLELSEINRNNLPTYITVESNDNPYQKAEYKLIKRGKYIENGKKVPSIYTVCERNDFLNAYELINMPRKYDTAYLACVHEESNNYKFYELKDTGSQIIGRYGRIHPDKSGRFKEKTTRFSRDMYWIRYYEKIGKGYEDYSDVFENSTEYYSKERPEMDSRDDNPDALALFDKLYAYTNYYVRKTTDIEDKPTVAQVKKAGELLKELTEQTEVNSFNQILKKLFVLIPRQIEPLSDQVANYIAFDTEDFVEIINRERGLYRAMKGMEENYSDDTFQAHNVSVYPATESQKQKVLAHLEDSERRQVKNIYRVIPYNQKQRFNQYCKDRQIDEVRELWHGSTNENWLSIIENSVSLDHAAYGMFGRGLYFAPSSNKSQGYTSNRGSYWRNGNDSTYYMGLFATAFGNPLMVGCSGNYDENDMTAHGTNCVYAKRENTSLRRDEVVFYNNDAVLLNYIVEFENK